MVCKRTVRSTGPRETRRESLDPFERFNYRAVSKMECKSSVSSTFDKNKSPLNNSLPVPSFLIFARRVSKWYNNISLVGGQRTGEATVKIDEL